jgi:hypothetical protein
MLSIVALIAMAGVAAAANGEDDTLLNFGYDETNHVFIADVSATDEPYDCTLEDGVLIVGYGDVGEDGIVPIDTLTLEDEVTVFEFTNRPEEEVGDDFEPATEPAPYAGAEGPCGLNGTFLDGPVNHGAFVSAFNAYLGTLDLEGGRGCLVRIIAQSDLGKGDQQINGDEVDPEFAIGETGSVQFTTETASCGHGKPEAPEGDELSRGGSQNDHGKSGEPHGKSGERGNGH